MSLHDVPIGAVLAGKYRVERVLGRGGMGVVVEATQLDLERRVALKFLRKAAVPETSVALARFEREARTVARLRGSHIVQIFDVGKLEHGEPFIVMELLSGEDLSTVLEHEQRLALTTAVDYLVQTCEAMAEAHAAGVVHRDLKPANLFVTRGADGRPLIKVLDFGISKLMSAEASSPSLTGGVLGSPLYMSPEQLSSAKTIDHRSDVWSLGTILYQLLTGVPAFAADGVPQVCARILLGEPDPPSTFAAEVPRELEHVISTCLQKLPDDRYPSVADLALALAPFARKSSLAHVEAAIRIVRGSSLPHGPLPEALDSMPPPAFPAPAQISSSPANAATVESDPLFTLEQAGTAEGPPPASHRTVNISGSPGGITQGELKPLMSATGSQRPEPRTALARAGLWTGLALVVAAAVVLVAQQTRRPVASPPTAVDVKPGATGADAMPSSAANGAPVNSAAKLEPLPSSAAAAPPSVSAAAPRPPLPPRKTRPAKPSPAEPTPEELLRHR